jgi:hypothetical protein
VKLNILKVNLEEKKALQVIELSTPGISDAFMSIEYSMILEKVLIEDGVPLQ